MKKLASCWNRNSLLLISEIDRNIIKSQGHLAYVIEETEFLGNISVVYDMV